MYGITHSFFERVFSVDSPELAQLPKAKDRNFIHGILAFDDDYRTLFDNYRNQIIRNKGQIVFSYKGKAAEYDYLNYLLNVCC